MPKSSPHAHRRFEGLVLLSDDARRVRKALARAGLKGWRVKPLGPGAPQMFAVPPSRVRIGTARAWDLVYRLREDRDVTYVEPAFETAGLVGRERRGKKPAAGVRAKDIPESDPHDWTLELCRVRQAWRLLDGRPGEGVVLAHPDTGYSGHPQLTAAALLPEEGYDFVDDDPDPKDPLTHGKPGHGTATASVIVSAEDAELTGFAWGAKIVPLRVDTGVVHWSWRRLAAALYLAASAKRPIASMSLGGAYGTSTLDEAVRHARKHGMILIAAAGNHGGNVVFPACLPEVVAVAACNARSEPWVDTCSGPEIAIAAPGESVWRARADAPGEFDVKRSSGTSYATALTAAAAALWIDRHGGFAALERRFGLIGVAGAFKEALMGSATVPAGWDTSSLGAGIVNAEALLKRSLPSRAPARGARVAALRQRVPTTWERIAMLFPGIEPDLVQGAVRSWFRSPKKGVAQTVALEPLLDEIYFQLATSPALRAAIAASLGRRRRAKAARPRAPAISGASTTMRRMLAR
jgi:subtilisin family serine protease